MNWKRYELVHKFRQFLDIIILLVLALIHVVSPESPLKVSSGLLFFFLPGYSVTRFVSRNGKNDFTTKITYTVIISLCVVPFIGNLVQMITVLSSHTLLLAILVFSLPFLLVSDIRPIGKISEKQEIKNGNNMFYKGMAFFGALAIGLGLYIQPSIGRVAPRGTDIYRHMYVVNRLISTGKAAFPPDIDVLSNFYHFLYAELSLLTGLDLPSTGLVAQSMMGGVFAISMFYFTYHITGSLTASFMSAILFIAGPPLYVGDLKSYFWYFHPMWVAISVFPFALAYVHENLVNNKNRSISLAPMFIVALFLYHLTVGLMFASIIMLDFLLLLLKFRKKFLVLNFIKMVALSFCLSSVLTVPFMVNIRNPFKYVYPQGGLETLYSMFFGYSKYLFTSPLRGWDFFAKVFSGFVKEILPFIIIGVPGLVYLFLKRSTSFILIFSCVLTGLIGLFQPWLGLAFVPQRFSVPLIMFGSTLAGASLSLLMVIPNIRFRKHGKLIKIRVGISKRSSSSFILLFITFSFIFLYSYLVFFSPAREAVLAAGLDIRADDMVAIKWIDENIPRNSNILMDQYLQLYFTGITGRRRLFSITTEKPIYEIWDVYPVNVYIGRTDPLEVDVDYIVISPFCFTTSSFVGKEYFDQHEDLVNIYEFQVSHYVPTRRTPYYAVYKVK